MSAIQYNWTRSDYGELTLVEPPIIFHLGMDIYREDSGTLCIAPRKNIERIVANYERVFEEDHKHVATSPLEEKGDHPELDTSDLL